MLDSMEVRAALLLLLATAAPLARAQEKKKATPEHVVGEEAYPFDTVDPREEKKPPIELPDSVAPKLSLLTPEQIETYDRLRGYSGGHAHPGS